MQHELQMTDSPHEDVWTDFGYSASRIHAASQALGVGMRERMCRREVKTKTQAFAQVLEQSGEKLGIPLDTPTDYFILGAIFTATIKSMSMAEHHMARRWVNRPLLLVSAAFGLVAFAQLVTAHREWIGYACMAVLIAVLRFQLTRVFLD